MEDLEPLYVLRERYRYSSDWYPTKVTCALVGVGDKYIEFRYEQALLSHQTCTSKGGEIAIRFFCATQEGILYIADICPRKQP